MNKRFFNFVIHLPFLLHFVIFNSLNTGNFVLSCKGSVRTAKNLEEIRLGKNLQIFKTYKKRPSSDAPQENRIVKTLVFPENYPTAGTNNAYLDINDQITSDIDGNEENNMIENAVHSIRKKGMFSEEPITEDTYSQDQERNKEMIVNINIESKTEEEEEEIRKEGSGNDKNVQEKYEDNLRRRGELGSTRKSNEDSSSIRKEHGLLDDEENEEGSGLHGEYQAKNEVQERNNLIVKKRNSDDLEYGKATFKIIAQIFFPNKMK